MKRRPITLIALCAFLVMSLALVGCTDDQDLANEAMDRANEAVDKSNAIDAELTAIMDEVAAFEAADAKQAAQALEKLDEAKAKLAEKNAETQASIDELEPIASMDVADDYKTYVSQQIEIARLQLKSDSLGGQMVGVLREMYEAGVAGTLDGAKLDELSAKLDAIFSEGEAVDAEIVAKSEKSDAFFEEKGLE